MVRKASDKTEHNSRKTSRKRQNPETDQILLADRKSKSDERQADNVNPSEDKHDKSESQESYPPIVVLGGSAGGLEAFEQFFRNLTSKTGAAFIVISHLDPKHSSMMSELIGRYSSMNVREAADNITIEPDHVYVIPPNTDLSISKGRLRVQKPSKIPGIHMPIDLFLRSLAENPSDRAIAVILSGTGTDGTLGVRALQAAGGLVFVQDPSDAKYDGMPRSAIATGLADYVLRVAEIPQQLTAVLARLPLKERKATDQEGADMVQKVLAVVRAKTGHDFSQYKKNTMLRRIKRRMNIHNIEGFDAYIQMLRQHQDEIKQLFKELLINVTSFFREPEAYEVLKKTILPQILSDKPDDYTIRIWVVGCATGEEAYSIAITVKEYSAEHGKDYRVQMFATDLDEKSIAQARTGLFPANITLDVPPATLASFFVSEENGYRVRKDVRESIIFAIQDAGKDAPFTRLDLVSCRNVLIYMEPELQNKLIALFHYSLNPGGFLFLGSSESIGTRTDLFRLLDKRWKVFQARPKTGKDILQHAVFAEMPVRTIAEDRIRHEAPRKTSVETAVNNMLLSTFAPPAVVVNDRGEILYIHGDTSKYLTPSPGKPIFDIGHMAREGLALSMRSALLAAMSHRQNAIYRNVRVKTNGSTELIDLSIMPLTTDEEERPLFIFTFRPVPDRQEQPGELTAKGNGTRVAELEKELIYTREHLQASAEEAQAANEELKSANEELQSSNEELQSTNEELETSREELQSVNEELTTVNAELRSKIELLSQTESDIKNLLDSVEIGTIFLNGELRIKRFNAAAVEKIANVIATDIGRPFSDVTLKIEYPDLSARAREVIESLKSFETDIRGIDGSWHNMRIMPYRTIDNVIDGVVMTFTDVTQSRYATGVKGPLINSLVQTVKGPLAILDNDLRILSANSSFYKLLGVGPEEAIDRVIWDVGKQNWQIPVLRQVLSDVIYDDKVFNDLRAEADFPSIGHRIILVNTRRAELNQYRGGQSVLLSLEDVTENNPQKVI
ncbi:MAG TPA: chemotaxis protein CheB [Syntrophorhabdaceae bacterium]|nr:chemotaxis protein CheB [Syntrophorhabdaceae bacterium]